MDGRRSGTCCGRPLAIIDAPFNLGLKPPAAGREPGTRRAPDALESAGLHALLRPARRSRVRAPTYQADEGRTVNIRNLDAIADYAQRLSAEVADAVSGGFFPLVIGGDCSILLGPMLALRRRGDYGLLFIDGHTDFYLPEQSGTGGAAGMDLALVTGWGPPELCDIGGLRPYVPVTRVLAIGNRDYENRQSAAIPHARDSGMQYCDLRTAREIGVAEAVRRGLEAVFDAGASGIWIHLDVDVLGNDIMPAVDSPQLDGFSYAEMRELLRAALETEAVIGMQVTIFDPDLDPDGSIARELSRQLALALTPAEVAVTA